MHWFQSICIDSIISETFEKFEQEFYRIVIFCVKLILPINIVAPIGPLWCHKASLNYTSGWWPPPQHLFFFLSNMWKVQQSIGFKQEAANKELSKVFSIRRSNYDNQMNNDKAKIFKKKGPPTHMQVRWVLTN